MANADGSISIEVNLDVKDTEKQLARLKQQILKLETSLKVDSFKHDTLTEQAEALRQKIKAATEEVERYRKAYAANPNLKTEEAYTKATEKVAQLKAEQSGVVLQVDKIAAKIAETTFNLDAMKAAYAETAQSAGIASEGGGIDTSPIEASEAKISGVVARMREMFSEFGASARTALAAVGSAFLSLAQKAVAAVRKILSAVGNVIKKGFQKLVSAAKSAISSLFSLNKSTNQLSNGFSGGLKTLLKYGIGIRSLYVLFNRLRSAIVEGFQNLAQYSSSTNAAISSVKSALSQLKNALATAFAPIVEVVAPYLVKLINLCISAANAVARLVAALTGKSSYVRATAVQEDYAGSLSDTADAAGSAADAVEELEGLSGLDEINKWSSTSSSGGSGGGSGSSGTDASDMFETVAIEPLNFSSWGEAFDAFLDYLIDTGIPALKSALSKIADWINAFSANLYEMFTFPGVQDKVSALGTMIADAFDDFVNAIDWPTLGSALGAGFNTVLGFLTSIIYDFDWTNLGNKLATAINNFVTEVDWTNLGRVLLAKFKIMWQTAVGFFAGLDMEEIASAASDIVLGFFDAMTATIIETPWEKIGQQITSFLTGLNWAGIASSISQAAAGLFNGIYSLASSIDGAKIAKSLSEFFKGLEWGEIGLAFSDSAKAIIETLYDFFENLDTNAITEGITEFIEGADWAGIAESLLKLLKAVWDDVWSVIGGVTANLIDDYNTKSFEESRAIIILGKNYSEEAVQVLEGVYSSCVGTYNLFCRKLEVTTDETGATIYNTVDKYGNKVTASVDETGNTIVTKTDETGQQTIYTVDKNNNVVLTTVRDASGNIISITDATGEEAYGITESTGDDIIRAVMSTNKSVTSDADDLESAVTSSFSSLLRNADATWSDIEDTVTDSMSTANDNATSSATTMSSNLNTKFASIKTNTSSTFSNIRSNIAQNMSGSESDVTSYATSLSSKLGSKWADMQSKTSSAWSSISSSVKTNASTADSEATSSTNSLASKMTDKWSDLSAKTSNSFSSIKTSMVNGMQNAYSSVSTVLSNIGSKFSSIMSSAQTTVGNAISAIRSKFNFSWSLPSLKLPHISISGSFSLSPLSVPKFSISWYAKGGIVDAATLFGGMNVVGEAGKEAIVPLERHTEWLDMVADRIVEVLLDAWPDSGLAGALEKLAATIADLSSCVQGLELPAVATGQVLPSSSEFWAAVNRSSGDNSGETNSLLKEIRDALAGMNTSNTYNIQSRYNGRMALEIVLEEGKKQQRQSGKNPFLSLA